MDKKIITVLLFVIHQYYFSQSNTSKIDSLGTIPEVESFIRSYSKNTDDKLSKFTLKTIKDFEDDIISPEIKKKANTLGIDKSFYKGDFNHDGRTDLLFIGDDNRCIQFSGGSEKETSCGVDVNVIFNLESEYQLKNLLLKHRRFVIPKIIKIDNRDYINIYYEENTMFSDTPTKILSKTLTYKDKYHDFIEYNTQPEKHSIKSISYKTEPCYGTCPIFELELNKNDTSKFTAVIFNFIDDNDRKAENTALKNFNKGIKEGVFESQIKTSDFIALEELLNYINFSKLKDYYSISATDNAGSTLTILYDNGKTKEIGDYGLVGTYGLKNLYRILFDLRFNQEWRKIE